MNDAPTFPGHADCPNCLGSGQWWDPVWECYKRCPCKPEWRKPLPLKDLAPVQCWCLEGTHVHEH